MYSILKVNDKTAYDKKQFIVDTKAEINELPTDIGVHSMALCIEDGATYILRGDTRQWVALPKGSNS